MLLTIDRVWWLAMRARVAAASWADSTFSEKRSRPLEQS